MSNLWMTFTQYVIEIHKLRIAGVRHAMITDKDHIYDIGKISILYSSMEIFRKSIDFLECLLDDNV